MVIFVSFMQLFVQCDCLDAVTQHPGTFERQQATPEERKHGVEYFFDLGAVIDASMTSGGSSNSDTC